MGEVGCFLHGSFGAPHNGIPPSTLQPQQNTLLPQLSFLCRRRRRVRRHSYVRQGNYVTKIATCSLPAERCDRSGRGHRPNWLCFLLLQSQRPGEPLPRCSFSHKRRRQGHRADVHFVTDWPLLRIPQCPPSLRGALLDPASSLAGVVHGLSASSSLAVLVVFAAAVVAAVFVVVGGGGGDSPTASRHPTLSTDSSRNYEDEGRGATVDKPTHGLEEDSYLSREGLEEVGQSASLLDSAQRVIRGWRRTTTTASTNKVQQPQ